MSKPLPLDHPVVLAAVGAGAAAVDGAAAVYRATTRLPVFGRWIDRGVTDLIHHGDEVVTKSLAPVRAAVVAVAVQIVEAVLDELDLTELVRDRVDLDAVARDIDVDAIIDRVDMVARAQIVIDGVDLPAIIRDSTATMTSEVMTDVRTQGERADDMVSGIVDRMLGRAREVR